MIASTLKDYLLGTLLRVFKPVARIALRGQLTCKEVEQVVRLAFFEVARDDFGIDGRKTNIARVAIMTGLSRKECSRLKALVDTRDTPVSVSMSPSTRVLTAWHQDAVYLDNQGRPRELPLAGPEPSIESLFKRYAGDIPAGALLTELRRVEAIEDLPTERVRAIRRNFIPKGFDHDKVRILGNQLADLGATIFHNISDAATTGTRMQRYVVNEAIARDTATQFQELATAKGQLLLENFDAWLSANALADDDARMHKDVRRVGVGIYYFEETSSIGEKQ